MKYLWLLLPSLLFAADAHFSGTHKERHEEMRRFFIRQDDQGFYPQLYMTGDWGGFRRTLAKHGITISAAAVIDALGNPIGGKRQGFAQATSVGVDLNFELGPLMHLQGWAIYNSWVWRFGTSLTRKKIKNQFSVQQNYGNQTIMLDNLFLRWQSSKDTLHFKAGRINAGDDFLQNDLYYNFVSNAFCGNPVAVFYNLPFSAYPVAVWGAYAHIRPWERLLVKFAVYDGNKAHIQGNHFHGMNFTFKSDQGVLLANEVTYLINQGKGDRGYPGNIKLGYLYLTGNTFRPDNTKVKGDSLFYIMLDQMIYREGPPGTPQGLSPFAAFLFFPENKNLMPFFFIAGLCYTGLFPSRPNDIAAFGVARGRYSRNLQNFERAHFQEVQHYETVIELNYKIRFTPWIFFQPDIQYIITPRGLSSIPNALVLGFQAGLVF